MPLPEEPTPLPTPTRAATTREAGVPRAATPPPPPPASRRRRPKWETEPVRETDPTERPVWAFWRDRDGRRHAVAFVASLFGHALAFVLLTLVLIEGRGIGTTLVLEASLASDPADLQADAIAVTTDRADSASESMAIDPTDIRLPHPEAPTLGAESESTPVPESTIRAATSSELRNLSQLPTGGGLDGRSAGRRQELLDSEGGTPGSEMAVERGLEWLAAHQHEDGSWWFDLSTGPCRGRCRHSGNVGSSTAATGLALLCFLGHGDTPQEGKHSETVRRGLYYLQERIRFGPRGADLQEGTMYGQAIATLALTEAYGMTQDPSLRPLAQSALDFIVASQHKEGGWRYNPGQPGDMTVGGWQMMALHSGHLCGLDVPSPTVTSFSRFLDSVQTHYGARYRYLPEYDEATPVPTAVGLLCRMYLGWPRTMTPIRDGAAYLADLGPSRTDLYFDYYATQVLHHYGEPHWEKWNLTMREYLIRTQETSGHERGSWHFADEHGDQAGRLYSTAMSIMILEVYYRYLPLYGDRAVDFPY